MYLCYWEAHDTCTKSGVTSTKTFLYSIYS